MTADKSRFEQDIDPQETQEWKDALVEVELSDQGSRVLTISKGAPLDLGQDEIVRVQDIDLELPEPRCRCDEESTLVVTRRIDNGDIL